MITNTLRTADPTHAPGAPDRAWDRRRRMLAVGAALMALPYCALKIAWLSGSRIGLSDPSFGTDGTMHLLNGLTLGLDVVAFTLAAVFVTGVRAPKWFVLPTMWVGYGLLGEVLLVLAPSVFIQTASGQVGDTGDATSPIAGWVYAAVYTGFSGLGLCLLPAFGIYAWQRWASDQGWADRLGDERRFPVPAFAIVATGTLTVVLLVRALLADSALEALHPGVDTVLGLILLAGLRAGDLGVLRRSRRVLPLAAVWTTTGAWSAWGVYELVLGTIPNDLVTETVPAFDLVLAAGKVLVGMTVALVAIPRLSRR